MRVLKFDIEIPFWCSFKEFGTVNSHMTYPFPPPPTLFGLILNVLGKPALHTIEQDSAKNQLQNEYFTAYESMKFSVLVRSQGVKVDDYLNIMKRSRGSDTLELHLQSRLRERLGIILNDEIREKKDRDEIIKGVIKVSGKYRTFQDKSFIDNIQAIEGISKESKEKTIEFLSSYWDNDIAKYDLNKHWQRTQVTRQRLIRPHFTIILFSENEDIFSSENIHRKLMEPERPPYCGESDDLAILEVYEISNVSEDATKSSTIDSVIPKVFSNATVVSIPTALRNQRKHVQRKVCSIPHGDIGVDIECFQFGGDNFVFI